MAAETNGTPTATPPAPTIPQWITPDVFEDLLKTEVPGFVKIKDFKVSKAMAPGENYATLMLSVQIDVEVEDGKTKSLPFMLKVSHANIPMFAEMRKKHNIFDVEFGMYSKIVTEFEEMYRNVGLDVKFGAKAYTLKGVQEDYILLEDLRPRGFKNTNRLEGLDEDHMKCVLKKLAQWHAASATRIAKKGNYEPMYAAGAFFESNREIMKQVFETMGTYLLKSIDKYEGHESYIEDVRKLVANIMPEIEKCGKADPSEFNVLNHGDCWSNNIMFQYDAFGKIKETYLVDYQMPRFGSPAQDLLYFIISSTKLELKLKQFDYFIKFYHDELVDHLKLLLYPRRIPKLRDIHKMLYKYGLWGYLTATGAMTAVLLDPTENANMENFLGTEGVADDFKTSLFLNSRYKQHIEKILPWLQSRGALEC